MKVRVPAFVWPGDRGALGFPRPARALRKRSGAPDGRSVGPKAADDACGSNDRRRNRCVDGAGESSAPAGGLAALPPSPPDGCDKGRAWRRRASSGTQTGVSSPERNKAASVVASRRSILTGSPGRVGTSDGATTTPSSLRCPFQQALPAGTFGQLRPSKVICRCRP
jgi:hypothetical protein